MGVNSVSFHMKLVVRHYVFQGFHNEDHLFTLLTESGLSNSTENSKKLVYLPSIYNFWVINDAQ